MVVKFYFMSISVHYYHIFKSLSLSWNTVHNFVYTCIPLSHGTWKLQKKCCEKCERIKSYKAIHVLDDVGPGRVGGVPGVGGATVLKLRWLQLVLSRMITCSGMISTKSSNTAWKNIRIYAISSRCLSFLAKGHQQYKQYVVHHIAVTDKLRHD